MRVVAVVAVLYAQAHHRLLRCQQQLALQLALADVERHGGFRRWRTTIIVIFWRRQFHGKREVSAPETRRLEGWR